ncbi:hypothetical protein [Alishewanella longhuensis]
MPICFRSIGVEDGSNLRIPQNKKPPKWRLFVLANASGLLGLSCPRPTGQLTLFKNAPGVFVEEGSNLRVPQNKKPPKWRLFVLAHPSGLLGLSCPRPTGQLTLFKNAPGVFVEEGSNLRIPQNKKPPKWRLFFLAHTIRIARAILPFALRAS